MSSFEVRDRTERFRGRVITVVSDEVVMPEGGTAVRDYLLHPGAVAVVALDQQQRVLVVEQYRHPVGKSLVELPAGLLDVAGESAADTAARELWEEADLRAGHYATLADLLTTPGCSNEAMRVFLATDLQVVPEQERFQREHEEAVMTTRWAPLEELVDLALAGGLRNATAVAAVLATHAAVQRGLQTLRPADAPWPDRPEAGGRG